MQKLHFTAKLVTIQFQYISSIHYISITLLSQILLRLQFCLQLVHLFGRVCD